MTEKVDKGYSFSTKTFEKISYDIGDLGRKKRALLNRNKYKEYDENYFKDDDIDEDEEDPEEINFR